MARIAFDPRGGAEAISEAVTRVLTTVRDFKGGRIDPALNV